MDAVETLQVNGMIVEIHQDDSEHDPREWDNLGHMVCFHPHYDLGDEHDMTPDELSELVERADVVALPLVLYDHSGLTMSTSRAGWPFNCRWDSSMVGYIYAERSAILKEYGRKHLSAKLRRLVRGVLRGEVATYDQRLTGDVYGFIAKCGGCGEDLDSCWGFYGHDWTENGLLSHLGERNCPQCDTGLRKVVA